MKIENIDKNFKGTAVVENDGLIHYDIRLHSDEIYGVEYCEKQGRFARMHQKIDGCAEELLGISESMDHLNHYTAGGRFRFSTNSKKISVFGTLTDNAVCSNHALIGSSACVICEDFLDGSNKFIACIYPENDTKLDFYFSKELDGEKRYFTIFMPNYNGIAKLDIGIEEGSDFGKGLEYKSQLPIVYYGSSITQGGCASRADLSYQNMICRWNNIDYINLGFSGCAIAQPEVAEYISAIPQSVFVYDYDYNAWNAEFLKETHYKFYEIVRKNCPDLPIIMLTHPIYEKSDDSIARTKVVKESYKTAKNNGDKNVYFIDGDKLFGREDRDFCTVEGTHPNDLGFYRMAKAIYKTLNNVI